MLKFITKQIAKRYIAKKSKSGFKMAVLNTTINAIELYSDIAIYMLLYTVLVFILLILVPYIMITVVNSILLAIFSAFVILVFSSYIGYKLVRSLITGIISEINNLKQQL